MTNVLHKSTAHKRTLSAVLTGAWLLTLAAMAPAASAASVSYTISPAASSVRPGQTVAITLTVHTSVAIAGASVHLAFTNGSYSSFQTANSPALSFVDYHTEQNDLLFICNNNNCAPGAYQVATVTVVASQVGNMSVAFVPKETGDPNLAPLQADGVTGTYDITSSAPATTTPKSTSSKSSSSQSTNTVPQTNPDGTMGPLVLGNDHFIDQTNNATDVNDQTTLDASGKKTSGWSAKKIALVVIGAGVGLAILLLILIKLFGSKSKGGPFDGPYSGSGTGSGNANGSTFYTR